MIGDKRVAPMLPASDIERAKQWYADKLDLKPSFEDPSGVQYVVGDGTEFWLYPSQYAGTNKGTAMGFLANDLTAEMDELRQRGVKFEEYDIPGVKTVDGVAQLSPNERGAWFTDSEGNIIVLYEAEKFS